MSTLIMCGRFEKKPNMVQNNPSGCTGKKHHFMPGSNEDPQDLASAVKSQGDRPVMTLE